MQLFVVLLLLPSPFDGRNGHEWCVCSKMYKHNVPQVNFVRVRLGKPYIFEQKRFFLFLAVRCSHKIAARQNYMQKKWNRN